MPPAQLESPGLDTLTRVLTQPGEQARELQQALLSVLNNSSGDQAGVSAAAADVAVGVVDQVAQTLAARAGVDVDTLFPGHRLLLQSVGSSRVGGQQQQQQVVAADIGAASSSWTDGGSSSSTGNGSILNSRSSEPVQEAAQVAVAAAAAGGSGGAVSKSNGRVLRMRQL